MRYRWKRAALAAMCLVLVPAGAAVPAAAAAAGTVAAAPAKSFSAAQLAQARELRERALGDDTGYETLRSLTCPIVTAEDHWAEGGLGEAVLSTLGDSDERPPVVRLAVTEMPHSGKPAELLAEAGIDADGIAAAARSLARAHAGAS